MTMKKVPSINVDFTPIKLKTMQPIDPNERPYTPSRMKLHPDLFDYNSAGRRSVLNSRGSAHKKRNKYYGFDRLEDGLIRTPPKSKNFIKLKGGSSNKFSDRINVMEIYERNN